MPIYEFECSKCNNIFEDWCKSVADGDKEHFCPACNSLASRIISHTSFSLKGSGWYATEYGTKKNKGDGDNAIKSSASSSDTLAKKEVSHKEASPSKASTSVANNKKSSTNTTAS